MRTSPVHWQRDSVLQAVGAIGCAVDRHDLKVVDVDVEGVLLAAHVADDRLLRCVEANDLIDAAGIELPAVDEEVVRASFSEKVSGRRGRAPDAEGGRGSAATACQAAPTR